jgi:UDP-glucuronate decarboxylase
MHKLIERDVKTILDAVDLSPMIGKRVLITGASGLIGTYLTECLKMLEDVEIHTISSTTTVDGTYHLCIDMATTMFHVQRPFDYIIHAVGYGQPDKFMQKSGHTLLLNSVVTLNLLPHLKKDGHFLFISSSEIYSGLSGSCTEDMVGTTNTTHPRACYIEGKRCGETVTHLARSRKFDAKSARLALAYGPGTRPDDTRVLNEFIQRGIINKQIGVRGGADSTRTYCYISDVVTMLWNILLYGEHPIYNVGGESCISIGGLAQLIGRLLDVPVVLPNLMTRPIPHALGAPDEVQVAMNLYESEFGGMKLVDLEDGLKRTISYQRGLYR